VSLRKGGIGKLPAEMREDLCRELERARSFKDIFLVVKKAVKLVLGLSRVGLMLYIGDLPLKIFAYHIVGTNSIVLNRRILRAMSRSLFSDLEFNSTVFLILLHEYLHSLGYINEHKVNDLVYKISRKCFGKDHLVTEKALLGPEYGLNLQGFKDSSSMGDFVLVRDFEKTDGSYIC